MTGGYAATSPGLQLQPLGVTVSRHEMSRDPSVQSRFGTSKVRTGCQTCKSRRIKCDEGQSECARCIKNGRVCGPSNAAARTLKLVHYRATPARAPISKPSIDMAEKRLLHDFRTWTELELAGVHNPELWLWNTVHFAASEPAIKHAVLGLAALHRQFRTGGNIAALDEKVAYALHCPRTFTPYQWG